MSEFVEIENCQILRSTSGDGKQNQGAALVQFLDFPDDSPEWIPWRAIDSGGIERDGEIGVLCLAKWKARQIGFEV
jgi:hypothetical protein